MSSGARPFFIQIVLLVGSNVFLVSSQPSATSAQAPCARPMPKQFADGEVVRLAQRDDYPCRLELIETGVVLRADIAGTIPDPGENIVVDGEGRIYSSSSIRGSIAVWNSDGTFQRSFGRQGDGPHEFQRGNFMLFLDGQDRLHVLSGSRQWSVLETPSLEWISQTSIMPIRVDDDFTIVTPAGRVITSLPQETWFAVADTRGNLISKFGDYTAGGVNSPRPEDHARQITYAGNDRFWASPERGSKVGYSMELWGLDRERHLTLKREVPWYPDGDGLPIARDVRPPPYVFRVHADTTGLLFALTVVANENWDRLASAPAEQRREIVDLAYSVHLEAIDTRAGVVLASERFGPPGASRLITRFLPGRPMGYRHVDTPDGLREARFFRIALRSR